MSKEKIIKSLMGLCLFLYVSSTYCNAIIPGLAAFVYRFGTLSSLFILVIVTLIEAFILHISLKKILFPKALYMSIVGNIASTLVGFIGIIPTGYLMELLRNVVTLKIKVGDAGMLQVFIIWTTILCLLSALIELFTLKKFFKYSYKELWIPVFAGNIITYVLIYFLMFIE